MSNSWKGIFSNVRGTFWGNEVDPPLGLINPHPEIPGRRQLTKFLAYFCRFGAKSKRASRVSNTTLARAMASSENMPPLPEAISALKDEGNGFFRAGDYLKAAGAYTKAIKVSGELKIARDSRC